MKAIVIAAGRGKRLGAHTEELPKCLVQVGDRPILGWVARAFEAAGVDELVIIRGYRPDVLEAGARSIWKGKLRFVENREWETNNILLSLACARSELDGPCLVTYSDIIFTPAVARACAAHPADVALVIDQASRDIYVGRTEHPLDEGEVADLDPSGHVRRVGKRALPPGDAFGEFIGLAKLSATGAAWFGDALDDLRARFSDDQPFQRAARFRNAYLTDLIQHLIDAGRPVAPVAITGQWREIDTGQDLDRARILVQSKEWS
ncbi:MAG TPA: phosphocholine cytidylyltransferase family protein [Kofleriaceae bacterium]|nr:phosphocholine cytidylyltransferase family protein [Kofleriaceae bacterium]